MNSCNRVVAIVGVVLLGMASSVYAEAVPAGSGVEAELAALKARLVELEARQSDTWLNARRAEEVKSLVREVLADADTRASLLANGATAGYDKGFFIASDDGTFLLKIGGQIQFRYIYNYRNESTPSGAPTDGDDDEAGFQLRRVKLFFKGHLGSPKVLYAVGLQTDRSDETVFLDHAYFGYQVSDNMTLFGGEDKAPFLREEMTSSKYQLAVERSLVNEIFTAGRIQGIWVEIDADDNTKVTLSINDGLNSGEAGSSAAKNFDEDETDFAVTGRIDIRLSGQWDQMKDFSAWSGEEQAVFVGFAFHWEVVETGNGQASSPITIADLSNGTGAIDELFAWTLDGSIEAEGSNLYAALVGFHPNNIGGDHDPDLYGFVLQGGTMLIPDKFEPFIRWELIEPAIAHEVNLITFGANYYLLKHNAKITTDIVWALNSMENIGSSSGLGLLDDQAGQRNQTVFRVQAQVLF